MPLVLLSAGSNAHGQLGHSSNEDSPDFLSCTFDGVPNVTLPVGTTKILDLATGANHTIALLEHLTEDQPQKTYTEIWGSGDGRAGQLGARYKQTVSQPEASSSVFRKLDLPLKEEGLEGYQCRMVAAGWETTYLVYSPPFRDDGLQRDDGDVLLSMGSNGWGDLGVGGTVLAKSQTKKSTKAKAKPVLKELNRVRFGDILVDGTTLSSFGTLQVQSIAARQHHVVAHMRSATTGRGWLVGWGAGRHGQISPLSSTLSPSDNPPSRAAAIVESPQLIAAENVDDPYVSCSVGSQHTVILKSSGMLDRLGSNRKDQLDLSSLDGKEVQAVGCTWNSTFAVTTPEGTTGASVFATGSNTHGQLGLGVPADEPASEVTPKRCRPSLPNSLKEALLTKLACGSEHVLTLWNGPHRPEVWGWGWNEHGNLGLGTTEDAHAPVKVFPSASRDLEVVDLWAGSGTSWLCCSIPEANE